MYRLGKGWTGFPRVRCALGSCWCFGSSIRATLTLLYCFGFSWWLWSESYPTNHCDPQTRGGHVWGESCPFLNTTVLHVFLLISGSVFTVQCCFEITCKGKSLPLWFKPAKNKKNFMACVGEAKYWYELCEPLGSAVWNQGALWKWDILWSCSWQVRNSRSEKVAPREQANSRLHVSYYYWTVKFSPVRDSDLARFNFVNASLPSLLPCRACQK